MGQVRDFPVLAVTAEESNVHEGLAIAIPAYNPGKDLPAYVAALRAACGGVPILLVDDGSRAETRAVFRECAETVPGVEVVSHGENRGKGRALKTAFARLLERFPALRGCVTCDCDGQHAPGDVAGCLAALEAHPDALVLGCRTFDLAHVPWKSRLGNNTMRFFFRLVSGHGFRDTQTGLRAIPAGFMRELLECPGERFEFETRMLLRLGGRGLVQIPIRTLYEDGNRGTHFKPFGDSARIVAILLGACARALGKFALSSLVSFGVDIGLFALLYYAVLPDGTPGRLFLSVVLARIVSVVVNYSCNRWFVFGGAGAAGKFRGGSFGKYAVLAVGIMGASYLLTRLARSLFPGVALAGLKACVDAGLFLASYGVQRVAIFSHKDLAR